MTDRDLGFDIDGLVERGLLRYRAGDIDGALTAWEHALAVDPTEPRALGYVDYVRQNYDELVGRGPAPMSEMLIPFGLGRGDDDDFADGAEYEISISQEGDPLPEPAPLLVGVDDGWGLEAEGEPTLYSERRPALVPGPLDLEPLDRNHLALSPPFEDDETRDFQHGRIPARLEFNAQPPTVAGPNRRRRGSFDRSPEESGEATIELSTGSDYAASDFTGERTIERSAASRLDPQILRGLNAAASHERPGTSEEETRQHWPRSTRLDPAGPASTDGDGELAIEPLEPPPKNERFERQEEQNTAELKGRLQREDDRRKVEIEELVLPPPGSSTAQVDDDGDTGGGLRPLPVQDALTAGLSASIDDRAPPREAPDDRARRRIAALLDKAQQASRAGEHPIAIAAIDLALSEAPDLASAQKLVHKSREAILECYYRFFGDLAGRPVVVATYEELTRRALDTRAAFLLSRIDGAISFEDILDVAGMGRLEACRHLAHLLWRGIIRAT